MASLAGNKI